MSRVHATVPPKVDYQLTDIAQELHEYLLSLTDWATRHRAAITAARHSYDAAHRADVG